MADGTVMMGDQSEVNRGRRGCRAFALWVSAGAILLAAVVRAAAAPVLGYRVVRTFPHAMTSYTEGFLYLDGLFYEGTGLQGRSALMAIEPETGKVVRNVVLPPQFFGEGIVNWGPYLYEWTWTSHVGFVYDRRTMQKVREFHYDGEGWGMTRDAQQIITSNGSAELTFRDPETFQPVRSVTVHDGPIVVTQLNELEFVKGEIYANIWHSERMARISPADGHVIAYVDLSGLDPAAERKAPEAVLNGIAYDAEHDRLFVTGKLWPEVFEIKIATTPR